ncbi:MAG: hypothetical protein ACRDOO_22270 [Actinomadura sp.]
MFMLPKSIKPGGRRGLLALVTGIALIFAATVASAESASAVETLTVRSVQPTTPGLTTRIDVSATSSSDITQITATLRLMGSTEVFATVEDFALLSGTAADGVWRSATAVTVEDQKRYAIDIDATNAAGYHRHLANVGVIDNGIAVSFSEFRVTPTEIDVENPDVTVGGRLVQHASDGTASGMPGARVTLVSTRGEFRSTLAQLTTDPDGGFSTTLALASTQEVQALFTAGATYRPATTQKITVTRKILPTRVSISVRSNPGVVGEKITLVGRLERQSLNGTWAGMAGQTVGIMVSLGSSWYDVATATTGSDGSYVANVVIPGYGGWAVQFPADPAQHPVAGYRFSSEAVPQLVDADYRTAVTGFNATPEPVGKGATVTGKGRLVRTLADGTTAGVPEAYLDLEFSADGRTWTFQDQATTDGNGYVTTSATAAKDGYWRLRYEGDGYHLPATGGSDHVDVKYRTSLSSFNAAPEPVAKGKTITVSGKLNRYVTAWGPLGGKTVYIYFRPYKATAWTYMGVATSDKYGKWHRGFKASRDGTWYAKYKGSDTYLPVTSGGDYVDVR